MNSHTDPHTLRVTVTRSDETADGQPLTASRSVPAGEYRALATFVTSPGAYGISGKLDGRLTVSTSHRLYDGADDTCGPTIGFEVYGHGGFGWFMGGPPDGSCVDPTPRWVRGGNATGSPEPTTER